MKKIFLLSAGILFLCLLSGCRQQSQSEDPYFWDFGQVKEGEVLKHNFTLTNNSKNPLNIKGTNVSCGCMVAKIDKKKLAPGESTQIAVEFHSEGYTGAVEQFVYVETDSTDNPILKFKVKSEVIK